MTTFADNLRRIREAKPMTQLDLAYHAGLSIDSLRNWEQGRALPKVDALAKLARVLQVSADELLEGIGEPDDPPTKKGRKR